MKPLAEPFEIHRQPYPYIAGMIVCGIFLSISLLVVFVGLDKASGVQSPLWQAYIILFVAPLFILFGYFTFCEEPLIAVRG
ncbi:MAG: hypothetical protein N2C14_26990, partial [Planctomycetales bacterium]